MYTSMMNDFKNHEQLIYFILNNFRLSRIDYKFFNSLSLSSINNNRVTSNQVKLYYKILDKHKKQINRHHLNMIDIFQLPWNCQVLESGKEFTEGYVEITDDKIIIKTPYNRSFINEYRKNPIYSMKWNKELRQHEIVYNTVNFKKIKTLLEKHYAHINYCDVASKLIEEVNNFTDIKYWNPTLVYINGNFIVYAVTDILYDVICHYDFSNIVNVSDLVSHGIEIDYTVKEYFLNKGYKKDFVDIATNYYSKIELFEINKVVEYLLQLNCDGVLEVGNNFNHASTITDYRDLLKSYGIQISKLLLNDLDCAKTIVINFRNTDPIVIGKTYKHIKFVNSQPIDIK